LTVDLRRSPAPPAVGGRVPPHNLEAEASVLGSLMLDRNAIVRVADFLRPDDFYLDHHAQVYRAALNLYDRSDPIDLLTLAAELERMLVLERVGGQAFLAELESGVPPGRRSRDQAKADQRRRPHHRPRLRREHAGQHGARHGRGRHLQYR